MPPKLLAAARCLSHHHEFAGRGLTPALVDVTPSIAACPCASGATLSREGGYTRITDPRGTSSAHPGSHARLYRHSRNLEYLARQPPRAVLHHYFSHARNASTTPAATTTATTSMHPPRPGGIVPSYMMASVILNNLATSSSADEEAVSDTVKRLTQGYNATPSDDYLWSFWHTLLTKTVPELADEPGTSFAPFPESPALDRFVLLVKTLKDTEVKEISAWGDKAKLWTDLPLFGPQLRELWNKDPTLKKGDLAEKDTQKWLVSMRFVSLLVRAKVQELDHLAIWSLRSALEEETTPGAARDVRVSVAAMWLKDCGDLMWGKCEKGEEVGKVLAQYTKPGKLYDGGAWFCKERWEFWGQKLDELMNEGQLGDTAAARAKVASESLAHISKEHI